MKSLARGCAAVCVLTALWLVVPTTVIAQNPGAEPARGDAKELFKYAQAYERAGLKREAAETYEQLLAVNPASRSVVVPRLIQLYTESRQPHKALAWAKQYMDETPDPEAYLIGVYASIGNMREATALLEKEIEEEQDALRLHQLLLQLSAYYEEMGQSDDAEKAMEQAAEAVRGLPQHDAALNRLCAFYEKRGELEGKIEAWQAQLAESPGDEAALRALAVSFYKIREDVTAAMRPLKQLHDLYPADPIIAHRYESASRRISGQDPP